MKRGSLGAAQAGWIFLFSYAAGIAVTEIFKRSGWLAAGDLGFFALYVLIGQVVLNLLPGAAWSRIRGLSLRSTFRLRKVPVSVLMLAVLVYIASQVPLLFLHQATESVLAFTGYAYEVSVYPIANHPLELAILVVCIGILPPICEELLFRGVLLTGYQSRGPLLAAVMSSFLFALFHDNPYRLLELFAAAFVSALIVLYAGSIWPGIAVHMATNITYVIGSYVQKGDLVQNISGHGDHVPWMTLALTGVMSIPAIFLCWALLKRMKQIAETNTGSTADRLINAKVPGAKWTIPILIAILVFLAKQFYL
ncbi:CPBP family intramembrane metalloprotease [Cohnella sp. CFH 77786]|uniref:type II CAAX endopeptidase family protein n=1 Tax=Cohnella sp. CFH 77786 TaxID=2662265 RepID=UPI001C60A62A|nr:type II CAAX endopeptidase family protein [Cohnella sp. CFH 77786]MBW5448819.1 CPBP family intramembrane metalloprotease [Cohnella sp. CFH 77786]